MEIFIRIGGYYTDKVIFLKKIKGEAVMKKTKKISRALALVAVLACGAMLFGSCGSSGNQDSTNQNSSEQNSSGTEETVTVSATTDPDTIVGEQVTAEQWAAAFDSSNFSNYTMLGTATIVADSMSATIGSSGKYRYETVTNVKFDGKKMYENIAETMTRNDETQKYSEEGYEEIAENGVWSYMQDDGVWYKVFDAEDDSFSVIVDFSLYDFTKFTYDAEQKGYYAPAIEVETEGMTLTYSVLAKIVDGKLAYGYSHYADTYEGNEMEQNYSVLYYDYGTTSVELPEATVRESGSASQVVTSTMTVDVWTECFGSLYENVFADVSMVVGANSGVYTYIFDFETIEIKINDQTYAYVVVDYETDTCVGYFYSSESDSWVADSPKDYYSSETGAPLYYLRDEFENFTYDPETGRYEQTGDIIKDEGAVITEAYVQFEDGKIVAISYKLEIEGYIYNITMQFYGYGEATVTLPDGIAA
jgi:hypothetical protein